MDTPHAHSAPAAAGATTTTLTDQGTQLLRNMHAAHDAVQEFHNNALKEHVEAVRPAIQPLLDQYRAAVTAYREHLGRSSTGRPAELADAAETHAKKRKRMCAPLEPPEQDGCVICHDRLYAETAVRPYNGTVMACHGCWKSWYCFYGELMCPIMRRKTFNLLVFNHTLNAKLYPSLADAGEDSTLHELPPRDDLSPQTMFRFRRTEVNSAATSASEKYTMHCDVVRQQHVEIMLARGFDAMVRPNAAPPAPQPAQQQAQQPAPAAENDLPSRGMRFTLTDPRQRHCVRVGDSVCIVGTPRQEAMFMTANIMRDKTTAVSAEAQSGDPNPLAVSVVVDAIDPLTGCSQECKVLGFIVGGEQCPAHYRQWVVLDVLDPVFRAAMGSAGFARAPLPDLEPCLPDDMQHLPGLFVCKPSQVMQLNPRPSADGDVKQAVWLLRENHVREFVDGVELETVPVPEVGRRVVLRNPVIRQQLIFKDRVFEVVVAFKEIVTNNLGPRSSGTTSNPLLLCRPLWSDGVTLAKRIFHPESFFFLDKPCYWHQRMVDLCAAKGVDPRGLVLLRYNHTESVPAAARVDAATGRMEIAEPQVAEAGAASRNVRARV